MVEHWCCCCWCCWTGLWWTSCCETSSEDCSLRWSRDVGLTAFVYKWSPTQQSKAKNSWEKHRNTAEVKLVILYNHKYYFFHILSQLQTTFKNKLQNEMIWSKKKCQRICGPCMLVGCLSRPYREYLASSPDICCTSLAYYRVQNPEQFAKERRKRKEGEL